MTANVPGNRRAPASTGGRCPFAHERNPFSSSAKSGISSCKVPDAGLGSHEALEPMNRCIATDSVVGSSSNPTGTHTYDVLRSGFGTGEPHFPQKSDRNPDGLMYDEISSCPLIHTTCSLRTMNAAFEPAPLCFRQREQ